MKANIDENGVLRIKAETPIESYALDRWAERYTPETGQCHSALQIDIKLDTPTESRAQVLSDAASKGFLHDLLSMRP